MKDIPRKLSPKRLFYSDNGSKNDAIMVAGMGRSGTTLVADLINFDNQSRVIFEPFSPLHVKEARPFKQMQYMHPGCESPTHRKTAEKIVSGKIHNLWVNRDARKFTYQKRIIKDIRCNLMLKWLKMKNYKKR